LVYRVNFEIRHRPSSASSASQVLNNYRHIFDGASPLYDTSMTPPRNNETRINNTMMDNGRWTTMDEEMVDDGTYLQYQNL
jgi:hypothetical protein